MSEHVVITENFYDAQEEDFRQAVLEGLARRHKEIPSKFFYDEEGSRLFERICELDEYYLTRAEEALLKNHADEIAALMGPGAQLIEFGAGTLQKIRILLDAMVEPAAIIPVDISRAHLLEAAQSLAAEYPDVEVLPVCADFTAPTALPEPAHNPKARKIGFFPGSTIGNFTRANAIGFLQTVAADLGAEGDFLIGVDLKKDSRILHAAYNDSQGVTAAFNLNLLIRANRELGADFDLSSWRHEAAYNEQEGRVEMHLVSLKKQDIHIMNHVFHFDEGETIHTENSHKYAIGEFHHMAREAGFAPLHTWVDEDRLFSIHYLRVDNFSLQKT